MGKMTAFCKRLLVENDIKLEIEMLYPVYCVKTQSWLYGCLKEDME